MVSVADRFGDCLPLFLGGTTALLLLGCTLMISTRSPAHRQWIGELTLIAVFGWLLLACLPLPRLLPEDFWSRLSTVPAARNDRTTIGVEAIVSRLPSEEAKQSDHEPLAMTAREDLLRDLARRDASDRRSATESLSHDHIDEANQPTIGLAAGSDRRDVDLPVAATFPANAISWVVIVYLGGSVFCVNWLMGGRIWLVLMRRRARRPPAWLANLFQSLSDESAQRPQLLVSRHCRGPVSWGTWRPIIVLPLALARRRHREQVRMVLLHELAHVNHRDSWANVLVCLALPLLYGHPLYCWLRAQVRLAAELLADDRAAQQAGKLAYVEQLVALAKSSRADVMPLAGAVALYSSSSQFYRRMQMLISRTSSSLVAPSARWRFSSLMVMAAVIVAAAAVAGVGPAAAQQKAASGDAAVAPLPPATAQTTQPPGEIPIQPGKPVVEPDQPLTRLPIVGRLFAVADQAPDEAQLKTEADVLRAKLAATEQQVRALEEQLNALKVDVKAAGIGFTKVTQQQKTVTLTRVNEDGSISTENWTTGDDGRPEKLIWKKKLNRPDDSPIAAAKPAVVQDGRVVKEFKDKDGTIVLHIYDRDTGRLIETRQGDRERSTLLPHAGNNAQADAKAAARYDVLVNQLASDKPRATSGGLDRTSAGGLDLVSLATAYADAIGEVEAATSRLSAEEAASANKSGSARELEAAQLALRSAQRKFELLRSISSVAAEAANADLKRVQQLVRAGAASSELAIEAESRWKMLNAILESGSAGQAPEKVPDQPKLP
jgi:beta-lactamase regulating signal transducer with metallopeptidase domain